MPTVSSFLGMIILMRYEEGVHCKPHFHVRYNGQKASIGIYPLALLAGSLPRRVLGTVFEWASVHQEELLANWERARNHESLVDIAPLEGT